MFIQSEQIAGGKSETRKSLGLQDLYKSRVDTTYQDRVYLGVSPEIVRDAAIGHCVINNPNWINSIMCMGTFAYVGDIPAELVRLVEGPLTT